MAFKLNPSYCMILAIVVVVFVLMNYEDFGSSRNRLPSRPRPRPRMCKRVEKICNRRCMGSPYDSMCKARCKLNYNCN